jgi:hypothetical protein
MGLRIAFDLDGVLADIDGAVARRASGWLGAQGPPHRQRQRLRICLEAVENFWETLDEVEAGSVAKLAAAAERGRWQVVFLINRPATRGATPQVQSQRWLEAKGFARPTVCATRRSRGQVASALDLDAIVAARPAHCLDVVAESDARPILIWRHDDDRLPASLGRLGITVMTSVGHCLDDCRAYAPAVSA